MAIRGRTLQGLVILMAIAYVLVSGCLLAQSSGKGDLRFSSSPPGADVLLDNQVRGTTPCSLSGVDTGNHTLEFRLAGYQSYNTVISVSSGNNSYYASLSPVSSTPTQPTVQIPVVTIAALSGPSTVAVQVNRNPMVIGTVQIFSGTSSGTGSVRLMLLGPGVYSGGVFLAQPNTDATGFWSYTWNPGQKVLSGTYTIFAYDAQNTTSASATFSIVGGGIVSITASRFSIAQGDPITFSGMCTTGARTVVLTLSGPGQNGVVLGSQPVNADGSWSYRYITPNSLPVGQYSVTVLDEQQTASSIVHFTINPG